MAEFRGWIESIVQAYRAEVDPPVPTVMDYTDEISIDDPEIEKLL